MRGRDIAIAQLAPPAARVASLLHPRRRLGRSGTFERAAELDPPVQSAEVVVPVVRTEDGLSLQVVSFDTNLPSISAGERIHPGITPNSAWLNPLSESRISVEARTGSPSPFVM
jgi:hypothetical protein